jgi:hypothetical protein
VACNPLRIFSSLIPNFTSPTTPFLVRISQAYSVSRPLLTTLIRPLGIADATWFHRVHARLSAYWLFGFVALLHLPTFFLLCVMATRYRRPVVAKLADRSRLYRLWSSAFSSGQVCACGWEGHSCIAQPKTFSFPQILSAPSHHFDCLSIRPSHPQTPRFLSSPSRTETPSAAFLAPCRCRFLM